jgi:hypothetical protein
MGTPDVAFDLLAERASRESARPEAEGLARALAAAGGGSVRAVIFFGSQRSGAVARNQWSAFDFFVLTEGYGRFYRGLRDAGKLRRSARLFAWLNSWLPPNQLSFRVTAEGGELHGKCAVIDAATFQRETSAERRDHFCAGRLFQPAQLVYALDEGARRSTLRALASAHATTLGWIRPSLPETFDAAEYCRTLLRVSLSKEIRPEPGGRSDALFEAQQGELVPVYGRLLEAFADDGELRRTGSDRFALSRPVTSGERRRTRAYFRRSTIRATLRWSKYVVTFEDWLDYLVRKAERHTGRQIVLAPRERRWPLVFLWPRVFRYLRDKDL